MRTTTTTNKTMTNAQLKWALKQGFAWADPINDHDDCGLSEVYWTREGGYMWNVDLQLYEMVL